MMSSLDEQRIDSMLRILREMKADMKRSSKISAIDYRDSTPVTNGAIVIHTQRLKSDPGGNLLS